MTSLAKKRKLVSQILHEPNTNGDCLQRNADGFVKGSITRIKLENFVTYDSVQFNPGPYLNVIIGPNGTGKSTIVCAVCLGLAGKTNLLGRATHPGDYIKHGCQKALVEIELFNPEGENYIIKREITKKGTNWWINRKSRPQKAVEDLVSQMNIQVGNLCQFLPQDRVADFAKMSQQELLENTEKAVGPPDMFENHNKLKTARARERDLHTNYTRVKERLEQEKSLNSRLEQDVKNYEERQRHLEKIKILKMKLPWMEYDEQRKAFQVVKERRDELAEQVKKTRQQNAPLSAKRDAARKKVDALAAEIKLLSERIREHSRLLQQKSKDIESQSESLQEAQDEMAQRQQEESQRRKKLRDYQEQLRLLQGELDNLGEERDVQPEVDRVAADLRNIHKTQTQATQRSENLKTEINNLKRDIIGKTTELKKIQDVGNRRIEDLRRRDKDTYGAVMWLRANQDQFRGKIHEPIMTQINSKDAKYTKYIETHISYNDMKAFVCEDKADVQTFLRRCRDEQNLRVAAVLAPPNPVKFYQPPHPITKYKDLFDAPEGVMRYLCLQYKVHQIPVGDHRTKSNVETVIAQCPELSNFYTENHQYSLRRSRYRDAVSSRCTELKKPCLLTVIADTSREDEVKRFISDTQDVVKERNIMYHEQEKLYKERDAQMEQLKNEKKKLLDERNQKRSLQQKIQMKQSQVTKIEQEEIDLPAEEAKIDQRIKQINAKKVKLLCDLKDHTKGCLEKSKTKIRVAIRHATSLKLTQELEMKLREQTTAIQSLEKEFDEIKERMKTTKDHARKLLDAAQKATNTRPNEELSGELKRAFETLPSSVEEVQAAVHEEQARADCTFHTDESVIQEYKRRKKDISILKDEVVQREEELNKHKDEIEGIKTAWLDPLQALISRINHNFSYFFRNMNCAGEVDLKIPDPPDDYERYGVRIKVKYRDNETLQELTPARQSGGERSVATVLYMMALQELTRVPFRCVDEINQGMDPVNERKVFELVVKTACRENTSQYFLLTPKLLPDLDYSDNMTVLCVYNGPSMMDHTEWNIDKFISLRTDYDA